MQVKLDNFKKLARGFGCSLIEKDHIVCIFFGCSVPVVLKPVDDAAGKYYEMIGECYVHGMMDGEAVADREGYQPPYGDAEEFELH